MEKTIFFNVNDHNNKAFSLPFDNDLKRYIVLLSKVRKQKTSRYILGIISDMFPMCGNNMWIDWIMSDVKKRSLKKEEWVKEVMPETVKVKMDDFPKFTLEERAEMVHLMKKFRRTTFWYNAIEYIKRLKEADLSWTLAVQNSLDELRGYYESVLDGKTESDFYNPLKP